ESGERLQVASPRGNWPCPPPRARARQCGRPRRGWTSAQPAEARVSILLYDALDFSTDRNDGGGQTRESLSRIASSSAAIAQVDVPKRSRFATDVRTRFARIGSV